VFLGKDTRVEVVIELDWEQFTMASLRQEGVF
jgi:hypothetical protein